jgi:hypothetical protein
MCDSNSYDVSKVIKIIERESRKVAATGWGVGKEEKFMIYEQWVSVLEDE